MRKKCFLTIALLLCTVANAFATVPTGIKTADYSAAVNDCVLVSLYSNNVVITPPTTSLTNGAEFDVVIVNNDNHNLCTIQSGGTQLIVAHRQENTQRMRFWNKGDTLKFRYSTTYTTWYLVGDSREDVHNTVPRVVHDDVSIFPNEYVVARTTTGALTVGVYSYPGAWQPGDSICVKLENYSGSNTCTVRFGNSSSAKISGRAGDLTDTVVLNSDGEALVATYRGNDGTYDRWELSADTH